MRKRIITACLSAALTAALLTGCGSKEETTAVENTTTESELKVQESETEAATEAKETKAEETTEDKKAADQAAADEAAALIDAIYVQEWTPETDEQCKAAKEAWDALTDEQKDLVEGEFADPDYFGRDTGDASKDNPGNADEIGENEILVVSFGTSFNDSRIQDIGGIEAAIEKANPDWSVRRAFTAQIIINHVQARDGEKIDNKLTGDITLIGNDITIEDGAYMPQGAIASADQGGAV